MFTGESVMVCKNCNREIPDQFSFCPHCGSKQQIRKRICPRCGMVAFPGDIQCDGCKYIFPEYPEKEAEEEEEKSDDEAENEEEEIHPFDRSTIFQYIKEDKKILVSLILGILVLIFILLMLFIVVRATNKKKKATETIQTETGVTLKDETEVVMNPSERKLPDGCYNLIENREVVLSGKIYTTEGKRVLWLDEPINVYSAAPQGERIMLKGVQIVGFQYQNAKIKETEIAALKDDTAVKIKGNMSVIDRKPYIFPEKLAISEANGGQSEGGQNGEGTSETQPSGGAEASASGNGKDTVSAESSGDTSGMYGSALESTENGQMQEYWNAVSVLEKYDTPSEIIDAIRDGTDMMDFDGWDVYTADIDPDSVTTYGSYNPYGSYFDGQMSGFSNLSGSSQTESSGSQMVDDPEIWLDSFDTEDSFSTEDVFSDNSSPKDYILPNSSYVQLTTEDIKNLTIQQINYAKNEIYARHGRIFLSNELQQYFNAKSWYKGIVDADHFSDSILNDVEKANIEFLRSREYELNPDGYSLD